MPARPKPLGQPTRGKTALNRLRQVDVYVLLRWPALLTDSPAPLVADAGYGAYPWTALEMLERWRAVNPKLRLLGVELDPERVKAALPYAVPGQIDFRLGGFNLQDVIGRECAHIIRAYNVLRQYDESAVPAALAQMSAGLALGGLLIEGTSTPSGGLAVFDVYQRTLQGLQHRELVWASNLRHPPQVAHFQAILPKRLIHHAQESPLCDFLADWEQALALAYGRGYRHPRRLWAESGRHLSARYPLLARPRLLRRGYLSLQTALSPVANALYL